MASMFRKPDERSSEEESHVTKEGELDGVAVSVKNASENSDGKRSRHMRTLSPTTNLGSTGRILSFPSLSQHKMDSLLHLSLLENHCRATALKTLNEHREPVDHLSEDHPEVKSLAAEIYIPFATSWCERNGVSLELVGEEGAALRKEMSARSQDYFSNQAKVRLRQLQSPTGSSSNIGEVVTFGPFKQSRPLSLLDRTSSLVSGSTHSPFKLHSPYMNEYEEISTLGKGGYGQVFRVRSYLDNQEYAVKKILITSQRVIKYLRTDQIDALLAEVRTLAKLNHSNVVRYYHAWIEHVPVLVAKSAASSEDKSNRRLLPEPQTEDTITHSYVTCTEESKDPEPESASAGRQELSQEIGNALAEETHDDNVVFENSPGHGEDPLADATHLGRESRATRLSSVTFQTSILSVTEAEDDVDVEDIPRAAEDIGQSPSRADLSAIEDNTRDSVHPEYLGSDVILYIKMSIYPITLAAFLSGDPPTTSDAAAIKHCFHHDTSVGILASILHGLEYLHGQKIVHRDIKPANIFLSIHEGKPPAIEGCVNITSCIGCSYPDSASRIYITPCIGDFGLIAEHKETHQEQPFSNSEVPLFEPSKLSVLYQKPVGTFFYRPKSMPMEEPIICPKLDVYSLGVIALELVYKFGTKSERAIVLSKLKHGILPAQMENHVMADGIKSMVCEGRKARWGCDDVRKWLEKMQGEGKGVE